MDVRKEDFPIVLQAYEILNNKELFIAEQVVNNQTEVDTFSNRYTGKLIKAKAWTNRENNNPRTTTVRKSGPSAGTIILIAVIILAILLAIGFATGWIQNTFNIHT